MCIPERPQQDHYDELASVAKHFSVTPSLTQIPRGHRYNNHTSIGVSVVDKIRVELRTIYRKHGLEKCQHYGLYWVGDPEHNMRADTDNIMLLVIGFAPQDVTKWWKIDGEVRDILVKWDLAGRHGVCVRYYQDCGVASATSLRAAPDLQAVIDVARDLANTRRTTAGQDSAGHTTPSRPRTFTRLPSPFSPPPRSRLDESSRIPVGSSRVDLPNTNAIGRQS